MEGLARQALLAARVFHLIPVEKARERLLWICQGLDLHVFMFFFLNLQEFSSRTHCLCFFNGSTGVRQGSASTRSNNFCGNLEYEWPSTIIRPTVAGCFIKLLSSGSTQRIKWLATTCWAGACSRHNCCGHAGIVSWENRVGGADTRNSRSLTRLVPLGCVWSASHLCFHSPWPYLVLLHSRGS